MTPVRLVYQIAGDAAEAALDKLGLSSKKAATALDGVTQATKKAEDAAEKAAAQSKELAERQRKLAWEAAAAEEAFKDEARTLGVTEAQLRQVKAEMKRLDAAQEQAAASSRRGAKGLASLAGFAKTAALEILAAVVAIGALNQQSADFVNGIADMARNLDFTNETLLGLGKASGDAGLGLDEMSGVLRAFTTKLDEAKEGSKEAQALFDRLGFDDQDIKNFTSVDAAFRAVVDSLAGMSDHAERAGIASKLLSERGTDLFSVLQEGSKSIDDATARAAELGVVLNGEVLTAANEWQVSVTDLKTALQGIATTIATEYSPEIRQAIADMIELITTGRELIGMLAEARRKADNIGGSSGIAAPFLKASEAAQEWAGWLLELGEQLAALAWKQFAFREEVESFKDAAVDAWGSFTDGLASALEKLELLLAKIPGMKQFAGIVRDIADALRGDDGGGSGSGGGVSTWDYGTDGETPTITEGKGPKSSGDNTQKMIDAEATAFEEAALALEIAADLGADGITDLALTLQALEEDIGKGTLTDGFKALAEQGRKAAEAVMEETAARVKAQKDADAHYDGLTHSLKVTADRVAASGKEFDAAFVDVAAALDEFQENARKAAAKGVVGDLAQGDLMGAAGIVAPGAVGFLGALGTIGGMADPENGISAADGVKMALEEQAQKILTGLQALPAILLQVLPEFAIDLAIAIAKMPFQLAGSVFEALDGVLTILFDKAWERMKSFFQSLFAVDKTKQEERQERRQERRDSRNVEFGFSTTRTASGSASARPSLTDRMNGALDGARGVLSPSIPGGALSAIGMGADRAFVGQGDRLAAAGTSFGEAMGGGGPTVNVDARGGIVTHDAGREIARRLSRSQSTYGRGLSTSPVL